MIKALQAKFTQHTKLKALLLDTNDKNLVENSADNVWGCVKGGNGQNPLGIALMLVRS